jgi:non-specific protein-tyrosine kinase
MRSKLELRDYVRILRVRKLLIIACTLIGVAAAAVATLVATPIYSARAQLFVSSGGDASVGTAYTGSLLTQSRVKSYSKIIDSPQVMNPVIDQLGLRTTPEALASKVSADAPLDTVLLNVNVTDPSPAVAQKIANATAQQFITLVGSLEQSDTSGKPIIKVSIVQPASLPKAPVSPKKTLNFALGLLAGLAIGVGAAVAREALDNTVKGVDDLRENFEVSTLGVIAYDGDTPKRPLVTQEARQSARPEAFRQIRTNLQFVDVDHQPKSIVISSSVPQEGKTTITCNLAITLAQAGVDIILVDADLRRPQVGEYMGMERAAGLTDVLIGRIELDDVLQRWGAIPHLRVLLSGPLPPNPSELLGSKAMADLLARLESRALVIIDAPPLLPVTDAAVLATAASGVVLVVARRTHRDQVRKAVTTLRGVGGHIFGAVLNKTPSRGPEAYQYGYGYGYSYDVKAPRRQRLRAAVDVTPATRLHASAQPPGASPPRSNSPDVAGGSTSPPPDRSATVTPTRQDPEAGPNQGVRVVHPTADDVGPVLVEDAIRELRETETDCDRLDGRQDAGSSQSVGTGLDEEPELGEVGDGHRDTGPDLDRRLREEVGQRRDN